jgi:hypothetical protein
MPLRHFAPAAKLADAHGQRLDGRLFALYHPTAALRSTALRATLLEDARRLGSVPRAADHA